MGMVDNESGDDDGGDEAGGSGEQRTGILGAELGHIERRVQAMVEVEVCLLVHRVVRQSHRGQNHLVRVWQPVRHSQRVECCVQKPFTVCRCYYAIDDYGAPQSIRIVQPLLHYSGYVGHQI